jgi:hypothetical protein
VLSLLAAATLLTAALGRREHVVHVRPGTDSAVELRIAVPLMHSASLDRYAAAGELGLLTLSEWFGPPTSSRLVVAPDVSWLVPMRFRVLEADVIRAVASAYWEQRASTAESDRQLADALAWYSTDRILHTAYVGERRYVVRFLGVVPWVVRPALVDDIDPALSQLQRALPAARAALALHTLERYLGWAAVQLVLSAAASSDASAPLTDRIAAAAQQVTGRNLTWFLQPAFHTAQSYDYGIEQLTTVPLNTEPPSYRTTLVVRRHGDAVFSGSTRASASESTSGGAITVRVRFADDVELEDQWDGRDRSRTFTYESRAPAHTAWVDPERVIALDVNPLNNARTFAPPPSGVFRRWTLHWVTWLQDAALTYSMLL